MTPAKTQQGERQGVSPPCPSRLHATSELEGRNSGKRTHAVHHSSRVPGDHFNFSRPLPARLAGAQVLSLTIASSRCPLPCPARLAGSQVSSWSRRTYATNFPIRSDKPTGAAFGSVSSLTTKRLLMPDKLARGVHCSRTTMDGHCLNQHQKEKLDNVLASR